jgi:hypothetical protein
MLNSPVVRKNISERNNKSWNSHFKPNKRTSKTKIEEDINEDTILTKQLSILNKKIWELNINILY